jgi:hypothetical protein
MCRRGEKFFAPTESFARTTCDTDMGVRIQPPSSLAAAMAAMVPSDTAVVICRYFL